jgi:hypothetical protein
MARRYLLARQTSVHNRHKFSGYVGKIPENSLRQTRQTEQHWNTYVKAGSAGNAILSTAGGRARVPRASESGTSNLQTAPLKMQVVVQIHVRTGKNCHSAALYVNSLSLSLLRIAIYEEWCLLGCYAVWLLTAVKTSNLTIAI